MNEIFYLVLTFWNSGAVVIPVPYDYAKCVAAMTSMERKVEKALCVPAPTVPVSPFVGSPSERGGTTYPEIKPCQSMTCTADGKNCKCN